MEPKFDREETIIRLREMLSENNNDLKRETQQYLWEGERQIIELIKVLDIAKSLRATQTRGGYTVDNKHAIKRIADHLKRMTVPEPPPPPKKGRQPKDPFEKLILPFAVEMARKWVMGNIEYDTKTKLYHEVAKLLFDAGFRGGKTPHEWKTEPIQEDAKSFLQHYF